VIEISYSRREEIKDTHLEILAVASWWKVLCQRVGLQVSLSMPYTVKMISFKYREFEKGK